MSNGAVVIGCAAYDDPDIAALRYAHRDAARVAAILSASCGVAQDMLLVLSDDAQDQKFRPTRTNIVRRVSGWDRLSVIDGILYCFFSGHGFQSGDDQYFLPIDCVRSVLEDTAVRFDLLLRMLSVSPARHVVLFLDACRSVVQGGKAQGGSLSRANVAELCPPGMVSFCSCKPGKASYEAEAIQSGVFTAALCDALSDAGRCTTIYELDNFLARRIPEIAAAHGKPRQDLYSKVEPLGVQQLPIVSALQQNLWLAATPIGSERRANSAPVSVPAHRTSSSRGSLVAFDFGTSYSAASTVGPDGKSMLVPWSGQRILMPSVVHFLPGLEYLVGAAAVEADRYAPESTIWHVKRSLGTDSSFEIGGRSISAELAASLILRSLRASAEQALGCPVRRCLASYPANFSIAQRNALQRAFELAGLDVFRMIGEPNAAALTLTESVPAGEGACLIVDLGGGTFDVAVVQYGQGVCELVAASGSNAVGGLDFDAALTEYIGRELRERAGCAGPFDPVVAAQIRREASRAKRELGLHDQATILLQDVEVGVRGLQDISIPLSREKFREITASLNAQIRDVLGQVYGAWAIQTREMAPAEPKIVLAGQGTKIFTVRDELEPFEHGARYVTQFQETAVAYGLGCQAGVLSGTNPDVLLLDLSPVGIGIRCAAPARYRGNEHVQTLESPIIVAADSNSNNNVCIITPPNSTIPTLRTEEVQLPASPDRPIRVEVVEDRRGAILQIGTVMLPGHSEERRAEIAVDIDAGNTITVQVNDRVLMEYRSFQLNNLHAMPAPYLTRLYTGQYSDTHSLLAAGYAVYPVQPSDTPVAAQSSAVHMDNFVQSELAILDALIADAERNGSSDPAADRIYIDYYRHRASIHKSTGDMVAAALDYVKSFGLGRPICSAELSEILPLIESSNQELSAALSTGISALDPERSEFHVKDLESLATTLDNNGYRDGATRCRQIAAAAAGLKNASELQKDDGVGRSSDAADGLTSSS